MVAQQPPRDVRLAVILAKAVGDQADPFNVNVQLMMLGENVFTVTIPDVPEDGLTAYYINALQISIDGDMPISIPFGSMAQLSANINVTRADDGSDDVGPDSAVPPGE